MNTPIVNISDDQNEITHESGVVTVFEESENSCDECCYYKAYKCQGICLNPCTRQERKDIRNGIFKLKP